MPRHVFGGDWTSDKLERVRKYLGAYTTIFKKNVRARCFTTIYLMRLPLAGHLVASASRRGKAAAATPTRDAIASLAASVCLNVIE